MYAPGSREDVFLIPMCFKSTALAAAAKSHTSEYRRMIKSLDTHSPVIHDGKIQDGERVNGTADGGYIRSSSRGRGSRPPPSPSTTPPAEAWVYAGEWVLASVKHPTRTRLQGHLPDGSLCMEARVETETVLYIDGGGGILKLTPAVETQWAHMSRAMTTEEGPHHNS